MSQTTAKLIDFSLLVPFPHCKFPQQNIVKFYFEMGFYYSTSFETIEQQRLHNLPQMKEMFCWSRNDFLSSFFLLKKPGESTTPIKSSPKYFAVPPKRRSPASSAPEHSAGL